MHQSFRQLWTGPNKHISLRIRSALLSPELGTSVSHSEQRLLFLRPPLSQVGEGKVKLLWTFPAVLTLPFSLLLFQHLPVCYNPLIILEFWKIRFWFFVFLIFSIFLWRDWPLELYLFCWSQSWKGDTVDYVEFVVPMGRLSIYIPLLDIGAWIFLSRGRKSEL